MCPEADLPIGEMGRSHPMVVTFGCAAHEENDLGVRKRKCGVTGGGAGIATPRLSSAGICRLMRKRHPYQSPQGNQRGSSSA